MMAEADALSKFDFSRVVKPGKFLKFQAGKPLTLRVLTVDPLVYETKYEDKITQEITLSTRFAFVVYNFTDSMAQILQATPNMAKKIGDLHTDEDFGANIRNIDIKISPTGEKLERRYDIQVLPKTRELTNEQIKECAVIKLEDAIEGDHQRMSFYKPGEAIPGTDSGEAEVQAKENAEKTEEDPVIEDIGNEPINLDDIPF